MSTYRFVDGLVCRRFGLSTFWFVDVLACRRFGLSTFRFVDVLVCRRFGLLTFWSVDVPVCRRFGVFGCRRFGLSTFWPVTNRLTNLPEILVRLPRSLAIFIVITPLSRKLLSYCTQNNRPLSCFYINNKPTVEQRYPTYKRRIYSKRNVAKLVESLRNINWSDLLNCYDHQDRFTLSLKKISDMYETSFPMREYVTSYKKPWLTEGIKMPLKGKTNYG